MAMKITLNGDPAEIKDGLSIGLLLQERNIKPELVSVEHNGTIVLKEDYDKLVISNGDTVEFLYFMGGGKK
jgi:sulfur carrier protein